MENEDKRSGMPDSFDRFLGSLEGLPDVVKTKASTIRALMPFLGSAQTYIVQTYRQRDQGDTIFLECIHGDGSFRLAIPPKISEAIARQRDALTGKTRSKAAKAGAEGRKARGVVPFAKKVR